MQTILGSGGAIGENLARELLAYTNKIRLVSRHPSKVNPTDELVSADVRDPAQVDKAIEGSNVVYVTVGFEYKRKVWEKTWPPFIRSVIDSCSKHNAWLVFFDNVYLYDPNYIGHMTEETPIRPSSRKGKVRAEIAGMIMDAVSQGKLKALIARSADFNGLKNSVLVETVPKNLMQGKKANWFASLHKVHTFTFIPDAAKATAILGNTPEAYGEVWHLPTDNTRSDRQTVGGIVCPRTRGQARCSGSSGMDDGTCGNFYARVERVEGDGLPVRQGLLFRQFKILRPIRFQARKPRRGDPQGRC